MSSSGRSFESWKAFEGFNRYIRRNSRYIRDGSQEGFLATVVETSRKRRKVLANGSVLYRAQLGHEWRVEDIKGENDEIVDSVDTPFPYSGSRMKPQPDRATEGRVNPKGIPCLYLATNKQTAMGEMRGWVGSYISLGEFVIQRDVVLVDCTADMEWSYLQMLFVVVEPDDSKREECVWGMINDAFSEPVTPNDAVADYAPTQILAEAFKHDGCDGVIYGSRVGDGKSIALFDPGLAELQGGQLFEVKGIHYEFSAACNAYWIAKPGTDQDPSAGF